MSANIIFITPSLLKARTGISEAIDEKQAMPQIKLAQDMYVQQALGSTLYQRLQTGVAASNLTASETTLLNTYVTDCLVWYTMSLLTTALGYQFFAKGILQKTAEDSNAPSRADMELIEGRYKSIAEFYKQRMIAYLKENYLMFAEYANPSSGWDTIYPESNAYTCPIHLGDDYMRTERTYSANSSQGTLVTTTVTPSTGVSTFQVAGLSGREVVLAVRSGMVKGVTTSATANTLYLQIVGTTVTLPTGDVTAADEIFIFFYR